MAYLWTELKESRIVTIQPVVLHGVLVYLASSNSNNIITIYNSNYSDSEANNFQIASSIDRVNNVMLGEGILLPGGLYIDLESQVTGVLVLYSYPEEGEV